MDLHADQIGGDFQYPGRPSVCISRIPPPTSSRTKLEELVIATPDVGGSKRASTFSKYLGVPLVPVTNHGKANEVASMQIIGDVKTKMLL